MAAVHGPSIPSHPSPFRKASSMSISRSRTGFHPSVLVSKSQQTHPPPPPPPPAHIPQQVIGSSNQDPYYGHEYIVKLCAYFITHLFACPEYPSTASHSQAKLPYFIVYALHRTKLHSSITFASLVLLQRLKARFLQLVDHLAITYLFQHL
jgi:hypothetical protein